MYNSVTLCGRITRDVVLQHTETGKPYFKNTIAVSNIFNKSTDFINIISWNAIALNMSKFLKKGSLILVEGRLQVDSVGNENDRRTYYTVVINRVVFLESKSSSTSKETFEILKKEQEKAQINKENKEDISTSKKEETFEKDESINEDNSFNEDNSDDDGIEWE